MLAYRSRLSRCIARRTTSATAEDTSATASTAGELRFPVELARAARRSGRAIATVGIRGLADPELDAVQSKKNKVAQKARALKKENQGYPEKEGSISPKAQKEIVDKAVLKEEEED